ncbi:MAG: AI-2E family transporter [Gemmataceae bacterium]
MPPDSPAPAGAAPPPRDERLPAGWIHLAALAGLTLVGVYLCYRMAEPFLPALAWALALAVIAHPLAERLNRHIPYRTGAAGLATLAVVLLLVLPVVFVTVQLGRQATAAGEQVKGMTEGGWLELLARTPYVGGELAAQARQVNWEQQANDLVRRLVGDAAAAATGTAWATVQFLVMVFVLFFLFRDREHILAQVRGLLPVTRAEADELFTRTADAVHATVYSTVVTGLLQGVTGGLLFWWLGVPAPLLWGVVMTVLAILPVLGAFIVWVPVAVGLAVADRWGAAAAVAGWGLLMAGPVCNWAYAWLAAGRQRLHEVPALLAFVGGLAVFGLSGMVLGPVLLALTVSLIQMWRRRAGPA